MDRHGVECLNPIPSLERQVIDPPPLESGKILDFVDHQPPAVRGQPIQRLRIPTQKLGQLKYLERAFIDTRRGVPRQSFVQSPHAAPISDLDSRAMIAPSGPARVVRAINARPRTRPGCLAGAGWATRSPRVSTCQIIPANPRNASSVSVTNLSSSSSRTPSSLSDSAMDSSGVIDCCFNTRQFAVQACQPAVRRPHRTTVQGDERTVESLAAWQRPASKALVEERGAKSE